jgi:hypothetical protein
MTRQWSGGGVGLFAWPERAGAVVWWASPLGNEDGQNFQQRCNVNGSVAKQPEGVNCRFSYTTYIRGSGSDKVVQTMQCGSQYDYRLLSC